METSEDNTCNPFKQKKIRRIFRVTDVIGKKGKYEINAR